VNRILKSAIEPDAATEGKPMGPPPISMAQDTSLVEHADYLEDGGELHFLFLDCAVSGVGERGRPWGRRAVWEGLARNDASEGAFSAHLSGTFHVADTTL
jgi:hypothetical protein